MIMKGRINWGGGMGGGSYIKWTASIACWLDDDNMMQYVFNCDECDLNPQGISTKNLPGDFQISLGPFHLKSTSPLRMSSKNF